MPKVSVIIPAYNTEKYLRQCLDSVVGQTLRDIEIICVDDGSTDGSLGVLRAYAAKDDRIIVVEQRNLGGGGARNAGLKIARGDYLAFWDSDDFFEREALETVYRKCVEDNADVAIFKARGFDDRSKAFSEIHWLLKAEYLPEKVPFSGREASRYIFNITAAGAWNKLFKRSFISEKGIFFQQLKRANDVYFVFLAMAEAERITFIDQALVNYRSGRVPGGTGAYELPTTFYDAYMGIKQYLLDRGMYDEYEQSYVNAALLQCYRDLQANFHLPQLRCGVTRRSLRRMYNTVRNKCFPDFGIDGHSADYFYRQDTYEEYRKIKRLAWYPYLLNFFFQSLRNKVQAQIRRVRGVGRNAL